MIIKTAKNQGAVVRTQGWLAQGSLYRRPCLQESYKSPLRMEKVEFAISPEPALRKGFPPWKYPDHFRSFSGF